RPAAVLPALGLLRLLPRPAAVPVPARGLPVGRRDRNAIPAPGPGARPGARGTDLRGPDDRRLGQDPQGRRQPGPPRPAGRAAPALGRRGPAAKDAVPALVPLLKDADPFVRVEAGMTLAAVGAAAVPALTEALKDPDRYERMGAALALGHLGKAARPAVDALN